jgi:hypothetical protein
MDEIGYGTKEIIYYENQYSSTQLQMLSLQISKLGVPAVLDMDMVQILSDLGRGCPGKSRNEYRLRCQNKLVYEARAMRAC